MQQAIFLKILLCKMISITSILWVGHTSNSYGVATHANVGDNIVKIFDMIIVNWLFILRFKRYIKYHLFVFYWIRPLTLTQKINAHADCCEILATCSWDCKYFLKYCINNSCRPTSSRLKNHTNTFTKIRTHIRRIIDGCS